MVLPSEEQLAVLEKINEGRNVIIQAVPGAGKTTQILLILEHCSNLGNVLVLTYNRALKFETKAKIENLSNEIYLEPLPDAHTFHSYCQNAYGIPCPNDRGIVKIINENLEPKEDFKYDFLIVDECQDMTGLYFGVIKKIWHPEIQILMVGDPKQSIYGYNGADTRFLTMADKLLQTEFEFMKLSTSYRMTKRITDFLNNCILGQNLIEPSPAKLGSEWPKPKYIIDSPFRNGFQDDVFRMIAKSLKHGLKPDDIFILAPTIKQIILDPTKNYDKNPIRRLANYLCLTRIIKCNLRNNYCCCSECCECKIHRCHHNINIFIPSSDDAAVTDEDVKNKIVFCTFHKAKGLERKLVIVLNFDMSYHKYYNKSDSFEVCCNPLYVALTRSSERLVIIQTGEQLPFVNKSNLSEYAELICNKKYDGVPVISTPSFNKVNPSQITQHMNDSNVLEVFKYVQISEKRPASQLVKLSSRHRSPETVEIVSDINGNFVTALFDYEKDRHIDFGKEKIYEVFGNIKETTGYDYISEYTPNIIESLLRKTTEWMARKSGFIFKKEQIQTYKWITPKQLEVLKSRILRAIKVGSVENKTETEVLVEIPGIEISGVNLEFRGIIDVIEYQRNVIWEVKCVDNITEAHYLQLATYKFINDHNKKYPNWRYMLFNVKDDSIHELIIDSSKLIKMMSKLIELKYNISGEMNNDETFVSHHTMK